MYMALTDSRAYIHYIHDTYLPYGPYLEAVTNVPVMYARPPGVIIRLFETDRIP